MDELNPVAVVLCEDGYLRHPALALFWDVEMDGAERCSPAQWEAWIERHGIETKLVHHDSEDMNHPGYVGYFDNCGNTTQWKPEAPNGEDWFMLRSRDSEDRSFAREAAARKRAPSKSGLR